MLNNLPLFTKLSIKNLLYAIKLSGLSLKLSGLSLPLIFILAACGGNNRSGGPTAIPPDIVRPAQSTPEFVERREPIVIPTLSPTPPGSVNVENSPRVAALATARVEAARVPVAALGVATGTTTLYASPARGDTPAVPMASIPAGATVTVTGISSDSQYYAVYTTAGQAGWIEAAALTVFGGSDLATVTETYQPSAMATLLAQAMRPVNVIDQIVSRSTPLPQDIDVSAAVASIEDAVPTSALIEFALVNNFDAAAANGAIGLIQAADDIINVHIGPSIESDVIGQVGNGLQVGVIGFSEGGLWFEIANLEGRGWISAEYIVLQ